jgi:hypothetical protein
MNKEYQMGFIEKLTSIGEDVEKMKVVHSLLVGSYII